MERYRLRPALFALALLALSSLPPAAAAASFLQPDPTRTAPAPGLPWITAQWPVQVDADAVAVSQTTLTVTLPGQRGVTLQRTGARQDAGPQTTWQGTVGTSAVAPAPAGTLQAALNSATLIRSGGHVIGMLRVQGQLYQLTHLRGQPLLQAINEAALPAAHQAGRAVPSTGSLLQRAAAAGDITPADDTHATVRVLVLGTRNAAAAHPDLAALARLGIAQANQTYANTGVALSLELAGYVPLDYRESGFPDLDLNRIVAPHDGHEDGIHPRRDAVAADVVVLLTDTGQQGFCGRAAEIGASAETAFAFVSWQCIGPDLSLAHEIGHLHGALHEGTGGEPFPFGHGYQYQTAETTGWRTVMAYDCERPCPRLPYWSDPQRLLDGVPMGVEGQADNRRVLALTKAWVAGFR